MKRPLRLAVYTDIHHDVYANGLTLDDTISVEQQFTSVAMMADLAIFAGDRFRSRNPLDIVKTMADVEVVNRAKMGIPVFYLVGNHDRHTRFAKSTHSFEFIKQIRSEIPMAVVMDEMRVYDFRMRNGMKVAIYAFPAGCAIESFEFKDVEADYKIAVFHDLIVGSKLDDDFLASHGFDKSVIDREEFDLVIGGDNHVRQDLGFENTTAWYVGAAIQHTWSDAGKPRGITVFTISDTVKFEFIPCTSPKFVEIQVRDEAEGVQAAKFAQITAGNIVSVYINDGVMPAARDPERVINAMMRDGKARRVNVEYKPIVEYTNPLSANKKIMTSAEYMRTYIDEVYKNSNKEFIERLKKEGEKYI